LELLHGNFRDFCECQTNIKIKQTIIVDLSSKVAEDASATIQAGESILEQHAEALSGQIMAPNFKSIGMRKYFIPKNENLGWCCTFGI
jgi:hypothetical protein